MLDFKRAFPIAAIGPIIIALLLLFSAFIPAVQGGSLETIRVGGTGSALGGMQLLAQAFMKAHPESRVVVLPSLGSGGGIKALLSGKIDVSVSARPLKDSEKAKGINDQEYASSPVVFATHKETAVDGVTLEELPALYAGETNVWPDGSRLRLVMRPATETDTKLLRSFSPEMDKAVEAATQRDNLFVAVNDQDNASALEDIRGSLGLTSLGQLQTEQRRLKPLTFNGLVGTVDALRDGTYPYAKHLYLITAPDQVPLAAAFVNFVWSPEGRRILTAHGNLVPEAPQESNM